MTQRHPFKHVDVFTSTPFNGNPLAVILEADDLSDAQMRAIARWINLSETTFVLSATDPDADYRVRIFTPDEELPFAGHPTLGTAHALLEAGMRTHHPKQIIQQCGIGQVKIRITDQGTLAFASPVAILTPFNSVSVSCALNSDEQHTQLPVMIADMGSRWLLVPMISADAVLAIKPDSVKLTQLIEQSQVNGVMPFGPFAPPDRGYEVRGLLVTNATLGEDPVTGSANACLARYFQALGNTQDYRVHQGTAIHRAGRLDITYTHDDIWIGGHTVTVLEGTIRV